MIKLLEAADVLKNSYQQCSKVFGFKKIDIFCF
jgi:hypothetical protein